MKNLKNFAFGLLVAVLALGFSAFKSSVVKVPSWVYVQENDDQYNKIPFSSYSGSNCVASNPRPCSFIQDEDDMDDHGETLTEEQAQAINTLEPTAAGIYN